MHWYNLLHNKTYIIFIPVNHFDAQQSLRATLLLIIIRCSSADILNSYTTKNLSCKISWCSFDVVAACKKPFICYIIVNYTDCITLTLLGAWSCSLKFEILYPICFTKLFILLCCYVILFMPYLPQLSFQMWTNQMQDTLNSKKKGDNAFRQKDFTTAIDCYSQVAFSSVLLVYMDVTEILEFHDWLWL